MKTRCGGLELGGSKTVVAIGTSDGQVIEEFRYPTTTPEETLKVAIDWWHKRGALEGIGIASFGPLQLRNHAEDFGTLFNTPKLAWHHFSLVDFFSAHVAGVPLHIDTDVNAALRAELAWGAVRGMRDVIYLTVGTGIGAGIFCKGNFVHGTMHPEMGHLRVPRHRDDSFAGVCPYHRDCLEGLASGPAIEQRWGTSARELPMDHPAWDMEAWYLAQGIFSACTLLSPAAILLGGGISQKEGLQPRVATILDELSNGYFASFASRLGAPALGQQAGIVGALLLCGSSQFPE